MSASRDWLTAGAEVGVYGSQRNAGRRSYASREKVERLTKTLVVLANGDRYNRDTLTLRGQGTWATRTGRIAATDDPEFLSYEESSRVADRAERADTAVFRWNRDKSPKNAAIAAKALLATIPAAKTGSP